MGGVRDTTAERHWRKGARASRKQANPTATPHWSQNGSNNSPCAAKESRGQTRITGRPRGEGFILDAHRLLLASTHCVTIIHLANTETGLSELMALWTQLHHKD
uniref:Uncharacterized protein n=1 Tax=Knipowitschia caucasica TaxID=637954 RepID=A0AAV2L3S6_KNICA